MTQGDMFHSAKPFFKPKTVALVGASETGGGGWPRMIYANLEFNGFPKTLYLINPRREELWGRKVYPDFASLPEPVDLALTIVPAEAIPTVLAEGAANGLKAALIYAARFGEGDDPEGRARADAVRKLCDEQGLVVCGPNCMGALALTDDTLFYPATRVRDLPKGDMGVVFQSGGTFMFWMERAAQRGLGISYAVSSGNELNLDLADYINFMVDDPSTRMIACMVEGIRRPAAFMEACRRALAAGKPVMMVKVGRSAAGQAAARSHTGALASDDAVFAAVCRRYGVVRCATLDQLVETALAFSQGRLPKGPRIGMTGFSGGGKGLFLDYAEDEGAVIAKLTPETIATIRPQIDEGVPAENPLDCGAGIAYRHHDFSKVTQDVARDPNVDMIAVQGSLPLREDDPSDATVFSNILNATDKPTIAYMRVSQNVTPAGLAFQKAAGVPFVMGIQDVVRALRDLAFYAAAKERGVPALPKADGKPAALQGAAFEKTLAASGLMPPKSAFAADSGAAAKAAADVGFPVAVKIVSPQASHKTEVGGVSLNLKNGDAVKQAADDMAARLRAADPGAEIEGFLIQEMVDGLEAIIGCREDAQFGPIMVAGFGGVLVEAMRDVSLRCLPITEADARDMLDGLRGKALLGAFRGRPARDTEALVRAMVGLSGIFLAHRNHLADLEVNPLIVLAEGDGVRAVDVRPVEKS
jgi:acyl-CoA synthetase (NDP forming)